MDLEVDGITLVYNVALDHVWLRDTVSGIQVSRRVGHHLKEAEAYRMIEEFRDCIQRGLFDEKIYWEDMVE